MEIHKSKFYINVLLTAFWIRGIFPFVSQELIPPLETLWPLINILFDTTLVCLGLVTIRKKSDIIFCVSFLAVTYYISCIHNQLSTIFYINGLRDFIYILFFIPILRYLFEEDRDYFISRFDHFLYLFLWIQAPCLIEQFLVYGANDHGGGSLGNFNSGTISTLIYIISFYLIKKRIDTNNFWKSLIENKIYIILLFPSFLNETKISFIYLLLYFILLIPLDKKSIGRFMFIGPIALIALGGGFLGYVSSTNTKEDFTSLEYYTEMYLLADDTDNILNWAEYLYDEDTGEADDLPRFTKLIILPELNKQYPGHAITGYGVGQFKGGTSLKNTEFYIDNEWMLCGTVPYILHIYIQIGFFAIPFFIWFLWNIFSFRNKELKHDKSIIIYMSLIIILILFYNDTFRNSFMSFVLFYVLAKTLTVSYRNKE